MFDKIKNYIKIHYSESGVSIRKNVASLGLIGSCTIIIFLLCVIEQISNGLLNTKFIIKDLIDTYNVLIPSIVKYGLDSIFNTRIGSYSDHCDDKKPNTDNDENTQDSKEP